MARETNQVEQPATLEEAFELVRAAWRGLPADDMPPLTRQYLIDEGEIYEQDGRLYACAEV